MNWGCFSRTTSPTAVHEIKNVALAPYFSKVGLTYQDLARPIIIKRKNNGRPLRWKTLHHLLLLAAASEPVMIEVRIVMIAVRLERKEGRALLTLITMPIHLLLYCCLVLLLPNLDCLTIFEALCWR